LKLYIYGAWHSLTRETTREGSDDSSGEAAMPLTSPSQPFGPSLLESFKVWSDDATESVAPSDETGSEFVSVRHRAPCHGLSIF
jgi:hypothetical protein